MNTPVVLVTTALTLAILLAASLLIATGTRGEDALFPPSGNPAGRIVLTAPAAK
jgi:aldose sugar dehydrogenase